MRSIKWLTTVSVNFYCLAYDYDLCGVGKISKFKIVYDVRKSKFKDEIHFYLGITGKWNVYPFYFINSDVPTICYITAYILTTLPVDKQR